MIKIFTHHTLADLEEEINTFMKETKNYKKVIKNLSISASEVLVQYEIKPKFLERIRSLFRRK